MNKVLSASHSAHAPASPARNHASSTRTVLKNATYLLCGAATHPMPVVCGPSCGELSWATHTDRGSSAVSYPCTRDDILTGEYPTGPAKAEVVVMGINMSSSIQHMMGRGPLVPKVLQFYSVAVTSIVCLIGVVVCRWVLVASARARSKGRAARRYQRAAAIACAICVSGLCVQGGRAQVPCVCVFFLAYPLGLEIGMLAMLAFQYWCKMVFDLPLAEVYYYPKPRELAHMPSGFAQVHECVLRLLLSICFHISRLPYPTVGSSRRRTYFISQVLLVSAVPACLIGLPILLLGVLLLRAIRYIGVCGMKQYGYSSPLLGTKHTARPMQRSRRDRGLVRKLARKEAKLIQKRRRKEKQMTYLQKLEKMLTSTNPLRCYSRSTESISQGMRRVCGRLLCVIARIILIFMIPSLACFGLAEYGVRRVGRFLRRHWNKNWRRQMPALCCFAWCVAQGSPTAVGAVMLMIMRQHSNIFGCCRAVTATLAFISLHEVEMIDQWPLAPIMLAALPAFPRLITSSGSSIEKARKGDTLRGGGFDDEPLIVEVAAGSEEGQSIEAIDGGEIECDEPPDLWIEAASHAVQNTTATEQHEDVMFCQAMSDTENAVAEMATSSEYTDNDSRNDGEERYNDELLPSLDESSGEEGVNGTKEDIMTEVDESDIASSEQSEQESQDAPVWPEVDVQYEKNGKQRRREPAAEAAVLEQACPDTCCADMKWSRRGSKRMAGEVGDQFGKTTRKNMRQAQHVLNALNTQEGKEQTTKEDASNTVRQEDDLGYFYARALDNAKSPDPRCRLDRALRNFAEKLREQPTLPSDTSDGTTARKDALLQDRGVVLPSKHCAITGCRWSGETDEALYEHLKRSHAEDMEEVLRELEVVHRHVGNSDDRVAAAYNEAIAIAVRRGAPLASYSIDRRCLRNYTTAVEDEELASLICFSCARRIPYVPSRSKNEITWTRPCEGRSVPDERECFTFCDLSPRQTENIFGMDSYLQKYGALDGEPDLCQRMEEFDDWRLNVPFESGSITILCCPEDKRCGSRKHRNDKDLCQQCEMPCCNECWEALHRQRPQMPAPALTNDMMIFYAPREIYEKNVTVMEMICASTCLTSMICFTLEKRYRGERVLDENAHMGRHRLGARGNATSFPMPWQELLLQLEAAEGDDDAAIELPRSPAEISNFVSVLLKSSDDGDTAEALGKFVHQAIVRRDVVVELIENAHRRGHRAYRRVDLERMRAKAAAELPENGLIPEVAKLLPLDDALDRIQIQKAATPVNAPQDVTQAASELEICRPNGVVLEKSSRDEADINAQRVASLTHMKTKLQLLESDSDDSLDDPNARAPSHGTSESDQTAAEEAGARTGRHKRVQRITAITGNKLIDQFEPWYFGVAFAFLFKYCTGMPDLPAFAKRARHRRGPAAPRIELDKWMQVMARRCEGQLGRDWNFGFVSWNLYFRTAVNLSRTVYAYERRRVDDEETLKARDLEEGAIEICRALRGKYCDPTGKTRAVNGDMTKVRYVAGLSRAAKRLLMNLEHTSRQLAGTQETRRHMRFDTHANRIHYGVPIFVTFSPDERHNNLFIRFSRTRRRDPVILADQTTRKYCGRNVPPLDADAESVTVRLDLQELERQLPMYDERRTILARDPLASVDGFRTLVLLTYEHLFGMRVCPQCPDCNEGENPCQDQFGSNAKPEGGIFGRMDAGYTSIEAQKSTGSLHAHSQLFVQCLHQHTPLVEIMELLKKREGAGIVAAYLEYKQHVCRETYAKKGSKLETRLESAEKAWPEYETDTTLTAAPQYRRGNIDKAGDDHIDEARRWKNSYIDSDVQKLQERRQHHVHIYNAETGEREPLPACRRKDNPGKCKSDYPRDMWLIDHAVVLCQGLLTLMGLPCSGRRTKIGALHGPMGHSYLNGTHPALLSAQRCNSDVQLPYRFPITATTHDAACSGNCADESKEADIIKAFQVAQDAQAGYACDYSNKRQPLAFNEIRECCKGHSDLNAKLNGESVNYIGKRHAMRLMSDAYGKGIVRGQVECANLRANNKEATVTHAESFRTSQTQAFYGREFCDLVQELNDRVKSPTKVQFGTVDCRRGQKRCIRYRDVALLYGQRPKNPAVWHLSPYEFTMYWEPIMVSFPCCREDVDNEDHHVSMTPEGLTKLESREEDLEWEPGVDYRVKDAGGKDWIPFPDVPATQGFRHTWVLKRRRRLRVPTFAGAPVPKRSAGETERSAMLTMTYFHPWTLRKADADEHVAFAGALRAENNTWHRSLTQWLDGNILCEEARRHVNNFLVVFRVRGKDDDDAGVRSDEMISDVELEVSHDSLEAALHTRVGKKRGREDSDKEDQDENEEKQRAEEGMQLGEAVWGGCQRKGHQIKVLDQIHQGSVEEVLKNARASQRKETTLADHVAAAEDRHARVSVYDGATPEDIEAWLHELQGRRDASGRLHVNTKQYEMIAKVAERVITEMRAESDETIDFGEPLRWVMHGGPGTGKTHVIKVIKEELFGGVLGWEMGVEFQIVALQAVMANLLDGDTIHHACGIPAFRKEGFGDFDCALQYAVAKKVLQWRWLFIDEISMVSSKLLAQMDVKLRDVIRDLHTAKCNRSGHSRAFGGLNVVCSGDFWQLEPPDGGFLASIPCEFLKNGKKFDRQPTIAHGQSLMWGGQVHGMQGVTELRVCERTDDEWLKEVQEEIRAGRLSEENHRFLHGLPTKVPGSWTNGRAACGRDKCTALAHTKAHLQRRIKSREMHILGHECRACKKERVSRHLVADNAKDKRFQTAKFAKAPAIFANNDLKYDSNKRRAAQYAEINGAAVTWCCAKDTPSAEALQERPDLVTQKLEWLQRHDRESGNLYGAVPLIVGMPVALTDHIDRNPEKQLLRGRVGYLHSWALDGKESSVFKDGERVLQKLPVVALVKFYDEDGGEVAWNLPGLREPGLYPIAPKRAAWFLDKARRHPVLKITRRQLPLAPAFAMTAHAAQGQTLKQGAVVDLRLGRGTNVVTSYVALTRVQSRHDLLIYRPFSLEPFQKGARKGPTELLRFLRGERIDWEALEKEFLPQALCNYCGFMHFREQFHAHQWNRKDGRPVCKGCIKELEKAGTPYQCNVCHCWKASGAFVEKQCSYKSQTNRVCTDCEEMRQCRGECGRYCKRTDFSKAEWAHAGWTRSLRGRCRRCMRSFQELKQCIGCDQNLERSAYNSDKMWNKGGEQRRCRNCMRSERPLRHCGMRRCAGCEKELSRDAYSSQKMWNKSDTERRCKSCMRRCRGLWVCVQCKERYEKSGFGDWILSRTQRGLQTKPTAATRCNGCFQDQELKKLAMSRASFLGVMSTEKLGTEDVILERHGEEREENIQKKRRRAEKSR